MTKYCECGHLVKDHGDCGCIERVDGKYCKCSIPAVYFVRKNFVELEQEWKKAILANVELAKLNADYFERLQKIEAAAKELRHRKDTLVALKKYFENNCPEKIKYPEYYEFHLYVAIVEDLL